MIEDNRTYYKCEYCGNISQDYEEIETCEKTCGLIIEELTKIIDSCKKLNDLGCTIELREYPYYTNNKLDKASARIINKEYELAFRSEDVCIENNIKKEFKTLTTLLGDE